MSTTTRWRRRSELAGDVTRAGRAVMRALQSGDLARPETCSSCGSEGRIEAHHWSYDPRHHTAVQWLCSACHGRADSARRRWAAGRRPVDDIGHRLLRAGIDLLIAA
jgi:hypothetical protein